MVGDRGGRQKAADKQEDQASLAPPVNVPKKGADTEHTRKFQVGGPFGALHFVER